MTSKKNKPFAKCLGRKTERLVVDGMKVGATGTHGTTTQRPTSSSCSLLQPATSWNKHKTQKNTKHKTQKN